MNITHIKWVVDSACQSIRRVSTALVYEVPPLLIFLSLKKILVMYYIEIYYIKRELFLALTFFSEGEGNNKMLWDKIT